VITAGNLDSHIKIIKEDYNRRQTKELMEQAQEDMRNLEPSKIVLARISDSVAFKQLQLEKAGNKDYIHSYRACH